VIKKALKKFESKKTRYTNGEVGESAGRIKHQEPGDGKNTSEQPLKSESTIVLSKGTSRRGEQFRSCHWKKIVLGGGRPLGPVLGENENQVL